MNAQRNSSDTPNVAQVAACGRASSTQKLRQALELIEHVAFEEAGRHPITHFCELIALAAYLERLLHSMEPA
jgi:hypothetical protein